MDVLHVGLTILSIYNYRKMDNNNEVDATLAGIGFQPNQIVALRNEGFETLADFVTVNDKDISNMANRLTSLPTNRQGARIGLIHIKKLQTLAFWVKDCVNRGAPIDHTKFDLATLAEYQRKCDVQRQLKDLADSDVDGPGKFKPDDWIQWEMKLDNYLATQPGTSGIPLNYVIRDEEDPGRDATALLWQAPLEGANFQADAEIVFRTIKQCVIGTDAYEWIKGNERLRDGRVTMADLRAHYNGPDMKKKRVTIANEQLKTLHYKNELSFKFETYITKLKAAILTLERYDAPGPTPRARVDFLLDGINTNDIDIKATIRYIRLDPALSKDFDQAAQQLSEVVNELYPDSATGRKRSARNISSVQGGRGQSGRGGRGGRGRGGGGRGGRGGRGGGGGQGNLPKSVNGVDISDRTRFFRPDEWSKLPSNIRSAILNDPKRQAESARRKQAKVAAVGTGDAATFVSAVTASIQDAVERGIKAASREQEEEDSKPAASGPKPPPMGKGRYQGQK